MRTVVNALSKQFLPLLFLILALLLVACGGDEGVAVSPDASPYQLLVSSSDLAPGRGRLALTLWDGPQRLTGVQAMEVGIYALDESGEGSELVWRGEATPYTLADSQYWVSYPEFPAAGNYGVRVRFTTADDTVVENTAIIGVKEEAEAPNVGEAVPASQTRTLEDAELEELSSAPPYVERFYQMSVAEAVASGKPSVIAFATPGYCQSALCTPVLQSVEQVSDQVGNEMVNMVHIEVYRNFQENELDPAVTEWALPSEPWVFVLDSEGRVHARLDGPVAPEELLKAVQEVTGDGA